MDQRTWHVVYEESSGLIRGKGKQLTFFIPLGPGDPAERQQLFFFLPACWAHSLRAVFPSGLSTKPETDLLLAVGIEG